MHLFRHRSAEYKTVAKSKFFNRKWYSKEYKIKMNPVEHYLNFGWREGRNPSPDFNNDFYLSKYEKDADFEICPIIHYEKNKSCFQKNVNLFNPGKIFPEQTITINKQYSVGKKHGRTVVFAMFSEDGNIPETTIYYLKEIKKIAENIILVADNPIAKAELNKIKDIVCYCEFCPHGEYDFGSYKRGFLYAKTNGLLKNTNELVLCNDSCYGPVFPFKHMFNKMAKRKLDFWGVCANTEYRYHLQSYFMVFRPNVFNSDVFADFILGVKHQKSVHDVITNYEINFTNVLTQAGFLCDSFIPCDKERKLYPFSVNSNLTFFPIWLMSNGCPLVKVKCIKKFGYAVENITETLNYIKDKNRILFNTILKSADARLYPSFSIILPTYNRAEMLIKSVHSILLQTYQNFEIIIIDDGSTDNTKDMIYKNFNQEIKNKKIRYFYKSNSGVSKSRNYGLEKASNDWIVYVDSDNLLFPTFLANFAENIRKMKNIKTFYCAMETRTGQNLGTEYNRDNLLCGNYIDIGMFVHHIDVFRKLGGFDEKMTRLVDWDLIVRYTEKYRPFYIPKTLMVYNNLDNRARISNTEDFYKNFVYFNKKHGVL